MMKMNKKFLAIVTNDSKKYLAFLQFEKKLSNNTIKAYLKDL